MTITSRRISERPQNTLYFHHGQIVNRAHNSDVILGQHGTVVIVRNLFGSMPVRVKHRALSDNPATNDKEWEQLTRRIVGIVLASPRATAITIRNERMGFSLRLRGSRQCKQVTVGPASTRNWKASSDLRYTLNVLTQASLIQQRSWPSWVPVCAKTSLVTVKGAISLDPIPSKQVQFISVGIRPIAYEGIHSLVYNEVNQLFALSRFGAIQERDENDKQTIDKRRKDITQKQLKGMRKGIDRWPMFCLWVDFKPYDSVNVSTKDADAVSIANLQTLIEVMRTMITAWLEEHHFRPGYTRKKAKDLPESTSFMSSAEALLQQPSSELRSQGFSLNSRSAGGSFLHQADSTGSALEGFDQSEAHSNGEGKRKLEERVKPGKKSNTGAVFSNWSRIKSGNPRVSSASKPVNLNEIEVVTMQDRLDRHSNQGRVCPCDQSHDTLPTSAELKITSDVDQTEDDFVKWQHPISRETYQLNVRSGVMLRDNEDNFMGRRPATAPTGPSSRLIGRLKRPVRPVSSDGTTSSWLSGLMGNWKNPVFQSSELQIPQILPVVLEGEGGQTMTQSLLTPSSGTQAIRLSAHSLRTAEIIQQVDQKFILLKVSVPIDPDTINPGCANTVYTRALVLVDQHAADERCKVEQLLKDICSIGATAHPETRTSHSASVQLTKPIAFITNSKEAALLGQAASMFARWGILYDLNVDVSNAETDRGQWRVSIRSLPSGIYERCVADVSLLIELLRGEAWSYRQRDIHSTKITATADREEAHPWLRQIGSCPQSIIDILNSRACRSAIMFNDALTRDDCKDLIGRLAGCAFPFQCAHGRPSVVPLVDLGTCQGVECDVEPEEFAQPMDHDRPSVSRHERDFTTAFKQWQDGASFPHVSLNHKRRSMQY